MIPSQPTRFIPRPFASDGAAAQIPETTTTPGRASFSSGFPTETQLPLREGGVAPNRLDFNGILGQVTEHQFWQQSGGLYTYAPALNYAPPCLVFYGGKLWWCLKTNGPDTSGVVTPGTNDTVWQELLTALKDMAGIEPDTGGNGYNMRSVVTASSSWRAPVEGWYRVTCVGGGGSGGRGAYTRYGGVGGLQGGTTSFGSLLSAAGGSGGGGGGCGYTSTGWDGGAGGGGGAGEVATEFIKLTLNQLVTISIGAGGARRTGNTGVAAGSDGAGPYGGYGGNGDIIGGGGAAGAGNGGSGSPAGNTGSGSQFAPTGGPGGRNGTGYGGGGGGGTGTDARPTKSGGAAADGGEYGGPQVTAFQGGYGGAGGPGAVILEYWEDK